MTVDRKCPTCIGLATLGDEKSMTTVFGLRGRFQAQRLVGQQVPPMPTATHASLETNVEKPRARPLRAERRTARDRPRCASSAARSRGLRASALASAMQPLA